MSPFVVLQAVSLTALAVILIVASWQDLRTMRIANSLSVTAAAAFLPWALAGLALGKVTPAAIGMAVACAAAVFAIGTVAFALGAVGGGDVKLLSATTLFAGPGLLPDLLLITALVGGLIGLAILAGVPIGPAAPENGGSSGSQLSRGLPYAPAIAAGGLWIIVALAVMIVN